jgi:hypothetical protein
MAGGVVDPGAGQGALALDAERAAQPAEQAQSPMKAVVGQRLGP